MTVTQRYERNVGLAASIATGYFIRGGDEDDVHQEARIGLWIACRKFDPAKGRFAPFAAFVIHRRLQALVLAAKRLKHGPLNESVRYGVSDRGDEVAILELIPGGRDPLEVVVARDMWERLCAAVDTLTPLEREALELVLTDQYDSRDRRVENSVRRVRAKLKEAIA